MHTNWITRVSIIVIYQKHQNVNQSVNDCSEKISYLFKFIRFSTRMYTHYKWGNWCSCAMSPWKKVVLKFLHQKWLDFAVMGNLMKCKYFSLTTTVYMGKGKANSACHNPGGSTKFGLPFSGCLLISWGTHSESVHVPLCNHKKQSFYISSILCNPWKLFSIIIVNEIFINKETTLTTSLATNFMSL